MKLPRKTALGKTFTLNTISQKQARKMIGEVCPSIIKTPKLRNIVRRAVRKTRTKEFVDQLDAVLVLADTLQDLSQQDTAQNPGLFNVQQDGSIGREIRATAVCLSLAWKKLLELV